MAGGKGDSEGSVVRKTISPYDITSLDNPGLTITQVQLKGENYDEWARSIRTALRARKKFGFVDGTIKKPGDNSDDIEDWWTINSLLVSWIRNSIEPTLRSTISHVEVAKDLWDDIQERFSMANGPRIQQLRSDLAECKQKGLTIVNYFGKLKLIWDELATFDQLPTCRCGNCTCQLSVELEKRREEEKVHQFLMGLDGIYSTIRSNILANDPLPSLNRAYSMVIQDERVNTMSRGTEDHPDVMAMAVQSQGRGESREKGGVCSHCKQAGHDIDNCFGIIGYPDWWGDRPRGTMKGGGRGKNSRQRQSNGRRRGGQHVNAVQTHIDGTSSSNAANDGIEANVCRDLVANSGKSCSKP